MTNKELAVQLYIANIQANATIISSPNYTGKIVKMPEIDEMVDCVSELTEKLSRISND